MPLIAIYDKYFSALLSTRHIPYSLKFQTKIEPIFFIYTIIWTDKITLYLGFKKYWTASSLNDTIHTYELQVLFVWNIYCKIKDMINEVVKSFAFAFTISVIALPYRMEFF